jgi:hypothetical protein
MNASQNKDLLESQAHLDPDDDLRSLERTIDDSLALMLAHPELTAEEAFGMVAAARDARAQGSLQ